MHRYPSDEEWTSSRVHALPRRWAKRLLSRWEEKASHDYRSANVELRETTDALLQVRIPLDASDATICDAAATLADRCAGRAEIFHSAQALRSAMERICHKQGIAPPHEKVKDQGAIARMTCPLWWRRKLRQHQGRTVEGAAIRLGYVNKLRDLYVSEEGLRARIQQNARNAASLEATIARNELGQEFTLAELASKGTANKRIRRAELMTRIAGFERVALAEGHVGLFLTVTCPSRFHRFRTVNAGKVVIENPCYDPAENPRTANAHLAKVWARARAKLKRKGIQPYGFRVCEPQHDGTPHWHFLLFCPPAQADELCAIVRGHALRDSPEEKGASEHRFDCKTIDTRKGTAAGYIAKYVSKNIDGHAVGEDLNGRPATETAVRVEAWATRWSARQFQQIGGPPVGVWRELRRVAELPVGCPSHLRDAHEAANKVNVVPGHEAASAAWDRYCAAQGGPACGRSARIKLAKTVTDKLGRYGDEPSAHPFGVETVSEEQYRAAETGVVESRLVHWLVESNRHQWEILRSKSVVSAEWVAQRAEPGAPWTCVNNCTESIHQHNQTTDRNGLTCSADAQIPPSDTLQDGGLLCRSLSSLSK